MIIQIAKEKFQDNVKCKDKDKCFSNHWCNLFKKEKNLSTRKIKPSKIASTIITSEKLSKFLNDCVRLIRLVGAENFFNYDETYENVANCPVSAIRKKGEKNIKITIQNDIKSGVTVGIIESFVGKFLKSFVIFKNRMKKIKNIKNIPNDLILKQNISGWIDDNIMINILEEIYDTTKGKLSVLLMDRYPVHMKQIIKKKQKN